MLLDASTLKPLLVLHGRGTRAIHIRSVSFTADDSSLLVFTESTAVRFDLDLSSDLGLVSSTASDEGPLVLTNGQTFLTRPKTLKGDGRSR